MSFCKNCGAGLGIGRFCTNCGAPISPAQQAAAPPPDSAAPTQPRPPAPESPAEQTAIRLPAVQPDASTGARFPLYADELPTRSPAASGHAGPGASPYAAPTAPQAVTPHAAQPYGGQARQAEQSPPVWAPPPSAPAPSGDEPSHRSEGRKRSPWVWAVPLVLALLFATTIGIWLGNRDDDSADASGSPASESPSAEESGDTQPDEDPDDGQTAPTPTSPTAPDEAPVDLAAQSEASGPKPVAPGRDLANNPVRYPPANMLDLDAATAYRIPGDASGETITFTLPGESTIREVGLINGYAKIDSAGGRTVDWYKKNRRITEVEWTFDDGTTVTQELRNSSDLQVIAVDGAVTETVQLRIVSVSKPGPKPLSKDVTAISTVLLRGN